MDLSSNQIRTVDPCVSKLASLETLHLRDNKVAKLEDLQAVGNIPKLQYLSFRAVDGTAKNPVCDDPRYREFTLGKCPKLIALDSQRTKLPELQFDPADFAEPNLTLPEPESWLPDALGAEGFGEIFSAAGIESTLRPHVDEFEKAMEECRKALSDNEALLKKAR
mmetsp:Transcript_1818/g.2714  ORF Transcript_1818/g.2714 Transcript_1818/m.2714 type:complete len:165 (+) Transcript_1818:116-610(+)